MTAHIPSRMAPVSRELVLPEGRIAYDDAGAGPLVVLVPGLGDLRQEYRVLAAQLVAAGHRVVSMDLRGHGGSSTAWPSYAASAVGRDIVSLIRSLKAGPAVVVGTSMGAGAAAFAAAEAPDLVSGLVVIGPFVRDVALPFAMRLLLGFAINVAFTGPWAAKAWGAYYGSLYPSRKPADFASYRARLVGNLSEPGRMAAVRAMMRASKADVEARLGEVVAPALVVMGTKDPDFPDPAAEAATVARLVGGAEVAMVEGAGHYPHAEMPETVVPRILAFLAERRGG